MDGVWRSLFLVPWRANVCCVDGNYRLGCLNVIHCLVCQVDELIWIDNASPHTLDLFLLSSLPFDIVVALQFSP